MAFGFVLVVMCIAGLVTWNAPRRALMLAVVFIPWAGLDVDIGLRVTAYLVFSSLLFVLVLIRLTMSERKVSVDGSLGLLGYVIGYAIFWSLIQIPFLPETEVAGGSLRGPEARATVQIIVFLIALSPILVIPLLVRTLGEIDRLGRLYIVSVLVLAAIGWVQLLVWIGTGRDPLPVGFFNEMIGGVGTTRSGAFDFQGSRVYRMSSLGGEPKDLGSSLAVALLLVQARLGASASVRKWVWPFLFVSMIATYSTTAYLGWVGASIVQLGIGRKLRFGRPMLLRRPRRGPTIGALVVLVALGMLVGPASETTIGKLIESRTTARLVESESGALEDFNVAVLGFLSEHPFAAAMGMGLGNIHLYADPYLPDYAMPYASGTSFVAKSGGLRWVSEIGLISLAIFLYWVFVTTRATVSALRCLQCEAFARVLAITCVPVLALWMVAGQVAPQLFVLLGCLVGARALARRLSTPEWKTRGKGG